MKKIFCELEELWQSISSEQCESFISVISDTNKNIICIGAGRMGFAIKSFAMRLSHLGYNSFMIGDTNLPKINAGDIVIVNSSSGETPTVVLLAKIAQTSKARLLVLTSNADSTLGRMANIKITYKAIISEQLMKSAYEQFTFLLFDYLACKIFDRIGVEKNWVENNHSILE